MKDKLLKPTDTGLPKAITRIGDQVDHLSVPDLRALPKVLRDQMIATAQERAGVARQIECIRREAMAAATQLMLTRQAEWQSRPDYFERVKRLRGPSQ